MLEDRKVIEDALFASLSKSMRVSFDDLVKTESWDINYRDVRFNFTNSKGDWKVFARICQKNLYIADLEREGFARTRVVASGDTELIGKLRKVIRRNI